MKNYIFLIIAFLFTMSLTIAYAGSVTLKTYYPAPVADFSKLKVSSLDSSTTCTGSNDGTLFIDPTTKVLMACEGGKAVSYPKSCFNRLHACSHDSTTGTWPDPQCEYGDGTPATACPANFHPITDTDPLTATVVVHEDVIQTGANSYTVSTVCCTDQHTMTSS